MGVGKAHIKKGDAVLVLSGKDSGKQGTVLRVNPSKQRAIVEGLNLITRHNIARIKTVLRERALLRPLA